MKALISLDLETLINEHLVKDYQIYEDYIVLINDDNETTYYLKNDDMLIELPLPNKYKISYITTDDYIIIQDNETLKYGYINRVNFSIIEPEYDECRPFKEGLAVVSKDGKYGVIDKNNNIIIPITHTSCSDCQEERIIVKDGEQEAYYDKLGKKIESNINYYDLTPFNNGLALCYKSIIDSKLTELYRFKNYEEIIFSDFQKQVFICNVGYSRKILRFISNKPIVKEITYIDPYENITDVKLFGDNIIISSNKGKRYILVDNCTKYYEMKTLNKELELPKSDQDPIFVEDSEHYGTYCILFKNGKNNNRLQIKDYTVFDDGYSFVKPNNIPYFILIDRKAKKIKDTNYIQQICSVDSLHMFLTNKNTIVVVDSKDNIILEYPANSIHNEKIEHDNNVYEISDTIKKCPKSKTISPNTNIRIGINDKDNPLLKRLPANNIKIESINLDDLSEEEKIIFQIESYLLIYDNEKLNKIFSEILEEYKNIGQEIINKELEQRKQHTINLTFGSTSTSNSKEFYKKYIKKLSEFLAKLKSIEQILCMIEKCESIVNDENVELVDEFMKDIKTLKELYENLDPTLKEKNKTLIKESFEEERKTLIEELINCSDKAPYNSVEEWEQHFRARLHILITGFKEDHELNTLNNKIVNAQKLNRDYGKSYYDALLLYIKSIQESVKHIESLTSDEETMKKLQKFKNIKLDLKGSLEDNINYIIGLLEEVIKLEVSIEYLYEPLSYLPKGSRDKN